MKIAIITDLHFGVRGDSQVFLDNQEKFYSEIFFPKLDELGIKTILNLGDTFDRRKFVNFLTLHRTKTFFFDEIEKRGIDYHAIAGNHDVHYRNTNEINSIELLCQEYENFKAYTHEPVELEFDGCKIMLSPWITQDNQEASFAAFKKTKATILAGHFAFAGFEMDRGSICDHGLDRKDFNKFDMIWSGHFHHPSKYGNIEYLGAPYEMTWSDYDGIRGFHIFDTSDHKLERIENPYRMFIKLDYNDDDLTVEDINELDLTPLEGAYVKLVVKNKNNPYIFDLFVNKIQQAEAIDVKIIEDTLNLENISEEELIAESKDTRVILHEYVDSIETAVDKKKIKSVIDSLYNEAISI